MGALCWLSDDARFDRWSRRRIWQRSGRSLFLWLLRQYRMLVASKIARADRNVELTVPWRMEAGAFFPRGVVCRSEH